MSVQPLVGLLPMPDIRIDHLYASYKLVRGSLCQQYQIYAIMPISELKSMKQSLFVVKTLLLDHILKDLQCYVKKRLIK